MSSDFLGSFLLSESLTEMEQEALSKGTHTIPEYPIFSSIDAALEMSRVQAPTTDRAKAIEGFEPGASKSSVSELITQLSGIAFLPTCAWCKAHLAATV